MRVKCVRDLRAVVTAGSSRDLLLVALLVIVTAAILRSRSPVEMRRNGRVLHATVPRVNEVISFSFEMQNEASKSPMHYVAMSHGWCLFNLVHRSCDLPISAVPRSSSHMQHRTVLDCASLVAA